MVVQFVSCRPVDTLNAAEYRPFTVALLWRRSLCTQLASDNNKNQQYQITKCDKKYRYSSCFSIRFIYETLGRLPSLLSPILPIIVQLSKFQQQNRTVSPSFFLAQLLPFYLTILSANSVFISLSPHPHATFHRCRGKQNIFENSK